MSNNKRGAFILEGIVAVSVFFMLALLYLDHGGFSLKSVAVYEVRSQAETLLDDSLQRLKRDLKDLSLPFNQSRTITREGISYQVSEQAEELTATGTGPKRQVDGTIELLVEVTWTHQGLEKRASRKIIVSRDHSS